ncbi:hypothetical protein [Thiothrix subterranea]|uniref:Uncharacterized protein n=1 Tax=Thiothrix subterranea TaxID=2735563 RepID=A0ABU0YDI3_9GAMM|nr:hypothetical protein [Thiothrix subterranea]MDQ5770846.1 hypothetical protein [Thiothrix subterranea]
MGTTTGGQSVKFMDWTSTTDTTGTLWKSINGTGDISLTGLHKLADGTLVATGGKEYVNGQWKTLGDANGDGYVFKVSPQNANGTFNFEVDRAANCGLQVLKGTLN